MCTLITCAKHFKAALSGTRNKILDSYIKDLTKWATSLRKKEMPPATRTKFVPVSTIATIVFPILHKGNQINLLVSTKDLPRQLIYGDTLCLWDHKWNLTVDIETTSTNTLRNDIFGFTSLVPYMQERSKEACIQDTIDEIIREYIPEPRLNNRHTLSYRTDKALVKSFNRDGLQREVHLPNLQPILIPTLPFLCE